MASVNFNMRIDTETKEQLAEVLSTYGLTVPQAFKLFANQVIKTKQVPLSFDWGKDETPGHDYQLSEQGEAMLRESIKDFENGDYDTITGDSAEEITRKLLELAK